MGGRLPGVAAVEVQLKHGAIMSEVGWRVLGGRPTARLLPGALFSSARCLSVLVSTARCLSVLVSTARCLSVLVSTARCLSVLVSTARYFGVLLSILGRNRPSLTRAHLYLALGPVRAVHSVPLQRPLAHGGSRSPPSDGHGPPRYRVLRCAGNRLGARRAERRPPPRDGGLPRRSKRPAGGRRAAQHRGGRCAGASSAGGSGRWRGGGPSADAGRVGPIAAGVPRRTDVGQGRAG
eukprot:scaffold17356_cov101-Isochrysis_galbana.AAC.2